MFGHFNKFSPRKKKISNEKKDKYIVEETLATDETNVSTGKWVKGTTLFVIQRNNEYARIVSDSKSKKCKIWMIENKIFKFEIGSFYIVEKDTEIEYRLNSIRNFDFENIKKINDDSESLETIGNYLIDLNTNGQDENDRIDHEIEKFFQKNKENEDRLHCVNGNKIIGWSKIENIKINPILPFFHVEEVLRGNVECFEDQTIVTSQIFEVLNVESLSNRQGEKYFLLIRDAVNESMLMSCEKWCYDFYKILLDKRKMKKKADGPLIGIFFVVISPHENVESKNCLIRSHFGLYGRTKYHILASVVLDVNDKTGKIRDLTKEEKKILSIEERYKNISNFPFYVFEISKKIFPSWGKDVYEKPFGTNCEFLSNFFNNKNNILFYAPHSYHLFYGSMKINLENDISMFYEKYDPKSIVHLFSERNLIQPSNGETSEYEPGLYHLINGHENDTYFYVTTNSFTSFSCMKFCTDRYRPETNHSYVVEKIYQDDDYECSKCGKNEFNLSSNIDVKIKNFDDDDISVKMVKYHQNSGEVNCIERPILTTMFVVFTKRDRDVMRASLNGAQSARLTLKLFFWAYDILTKGFELKSLKSQEDGENENLETINEKENSFLQEDENSDFDENEKFKKRKNDESNEIGSDNDEVFINETLTKKTKKHTGKKRRL